MIVPADVLLIYHRWKANKQVIKAENREWGNIQLLLFGDDPWLNKEREVFIPVLRQLYGITPDETDESEKQRQKLISRIKGGTKKLWERWQLLSLVSDSEEQKKQLLQTWDRGLHLLQLLCDELTTGGYRECLYVGKEALSDKCFVCPVDVDKWKGEGCPMNLLYEKEVA